MTRKLLTGFAFAGLVALILSAVIDWRSSMAAMAESAKPADCEPARWSGKLAMGPGMGMMQRRGMGGGPMQGRGMMRGNVVRHRYVMMNGIPAPYAGKASPLPATSENIKAGRKLFEENCVSCHGKGGRGDGEAGKELNPPPADITHVLGRPLDRDDFFFWTISEGGEMLKTDMPAFKDVLDEKQRWQLVLYLRDGLGR